MRPSLSGVVSALAFYGFITINSALSTSVKAKTIGERMGSNINTNSAPPPAQLPATQNLAKSAGVQSARVDQTPANAVQGQRDPTPAPQAKPLELATSGSLGTRINTSA